MRDLLLLAIHLFVTIVKLLRPGGVRAITAESLLLKQQLIVSNRSRQRALGLPNTPDSTMRNLVWSKKASALISRKTKAFSLLRP